MPLASSDAGAKNLPQNKYLIWSYVFTLIIGHI